MFASRAVKSRVLLGTIVGSTAWFVTRRLIGDVSVIHCLLWSVKRRKKPTPSHSNINWFCTVSTSSEFSE